MAAGDENDDDATRTPAEPVACSACRGTGQVISNLGGTPSQVPCPWCDGGGVRLADHDAQQRWRDAAPAGETPATGPGDDPERRGAPGSGGEPGPGGDQAA